MTYSNLDEMYTDLGLVMQRNRITYSLLGETNQFEVIDRGVTPGSTYAEDMQDVVLAGGLLYDRSKFHGTSETVLIHSVEPVENA